MDSRALLGYKGQLEELEAEVAECKTPYTLRTLEPYSEALHRGLNRIKSNRSREIIHKGEEIYSQEVVKTTVTKTNKWLVDSPYLTLKILKIPGISG